MPRNSWVNFVTALRRRDPSPEPHARGSAALSRRQSMASADSSSTYSGCSVARPDTSTRSRVLRSLKKYASFIGPGLMVSVAYMDPGNYATGVTAGASNRYSLLFIVFLSNIIAIFLQILCIRLGSVTGYDLARCCREYLPHRLNIVLWFLAECAIVATDVAEVIGSAVALNILIRVPLPAGVAITVVDVLFVLMAYRSDTSSTKFVKLFEYAVAALVLAVTICFGVQLGAIHADARDIFRGFVPSKQMFSGQGMTIATSIVGSTVMIHSLFLGSGLVQPRLREYDVNHGLVNFDTVAIDESDSEGEGEAPHEPQGINVYGMGSTSKGGIFYGATRSISNAYSRFAKAIAAEKPKITPARTETGSVTSYEDEKDEKHAAYVRESEFFYRVYRPSYQAIRYCLRFSVIELVTTLATFALFVNSAIVIVAGATLYGTPEAIDADLYTIHDLLSSSLAPVVGTVFMLALLFSGQSAGIVCTIAGQMVSEGHINWNLKPWIRRLVTRSISIVPCLIISLCIGRNGLGVALNVSQVVISILLPPLTAPLIWFTSRRSIMKVELPDDVPGGEEIDGKRYKFMNNHWLITALAALIWLLISVLNVYAIVDMARNGVAG
ncbi:manganese transporter Smf1p [Diutina catenulata]